MKTALYFFACMALIQLGACSGDDKNTSDEDKMSDRLTESTWAVESVDHGTDGDLTFQYEDFSLAFTKSGSGTFLGDYYVANGGNAFRDAFGKWKLSDDLKTIILDNDQELEVEFQDKMMILDFIVPSSADGRVEGLSGHFTFTLIHTP